MTCVTSDGAWVATTPLLPMTFKGGGDVVSALFLAHYLTDGPSVGLARTAATMYTIMERTHSAGSEEMLLVQEQEAIASPDTRLEVSQIR
jgi:pyridoxine kinase